MLSRRRRRRRRDNRPVIQRRLVRPATTSRLERLSDDLLEQIVDFSRASFRDPLPVTSRTLREIFVKFAERKTHELSEKYERRHGRPFPFTQGALMIDQYYEICAFMNPSFKLILLGSSCVGKTSLVKRHLTGEFSDVSTNSVMSGYAREANVLTFHTYIGLETITFEIIEIQDHDMSVEEHFRQAQCAIIMFDVTNRVTSKNVPNWHRDATRHNPIPVVLCGNKVEIKDRKNKARRFTFHRKKNLQYYDISAKTDYNTHKPFLYLARRLTGDNYLQFRLASVRTPPGRTQAAA